MKPWATIRADLHLGIKAKYLITQPMQWYFIRRAGTKELVFPEPFREYEAARICAAHNQEIET